MRFWAAGVGFARGATSGTTKRAPPGIEARFARQPQAIIWRLFQRAVYRRKQAIQVRAEAVDDRDNGEADARRNQPILDRGRGRLVGQKSQKCRLHFPTSW